VIADMARPIDDQDQNSDEIPSQCRSGGAAGVDDDEEEMVSPQHESGEKITESIEKSVSLSQLCLCC
jgi:hypothetical protein